MSVENENSIEIIIAPKKDCVVSYTLNNAQPVRSTHIGNQPLFYMEFEDHIEEDENFVESFSEELGNFNPEFLNATQSLNKYDVVAKHFTKDVSWRENLLSENISDMTGQSVNALNLDEIISTMQKSRIFEAHYEFACEKGVKIELSDKCASSEFIRSSKTILINNSASKEDAALILAKEIRAFWQKENGTQINPLNFHPDQAIVVNRAQIADLNVFMVRVCWELQLAEEKELWNYIEHSSLADIGRAYAREACADFRTMNNGEAAQSAFEAWFLSERCRRADKIVIQQMLSEYNGYVFGEDSAASKAVAFDLVSKLGEYGFGKNYLQPYANVILNDPVFTEVRDRSNANFLWFIKFERSFKEAEQELQSSAPTKNSGLQEKQNATAQNVYFIDDGSDEQQNKVIQFRPKQ